jgi:hypothetical protein
VRNEAVLVDELQSALDQLQVCEVRLTVHSLTVTPRIEFSFLFCLVCQNLTDFKKNEDFSSLDYTFMITLELKQIKNETATSNYEIPFV